MKNRLILFTICVITYKDKGHQRDETYRFISKDARDIAYNKLLAYYSRDYKESECTITGLQHAVLKHTLYDIDCFVDRNHHWSYRLVRAEENIDILDSMEDDRYLKTVAEEVKKEWNKI